MRSGGKSRLLRLICGIGLCIFVLQFGSGCASTPYQYGRFHSQQLDSVDRPAVVIQHGKPDKTLDRLGWVAGIPERVFTLNSKASNHHVSSETVEKVRLYLEENDLTDVVVSVNDYDPKGQWRRLRENYRIDPFWRYSVGTLSWLGYTLFPTRVFGGDEYNPFTNSLYLTSDVPALVLAEAAYAKDIHSQSLPGTYATLSCLPILSLLRHSRATSDVLGYARIHGDWPGEEEAYQVLYPHVGATTFGPVSHFVPVVGPFMSAGGALVGHATGRTVTALMDPPSRAKSHDGDSSVAAGVAAEELAVKKLSSPRIPPETSNDEGVVQTGFNEPRSPSRMPEKRSVGKLSPTPSAESRP